MEYLAFRSLKTGNRVIIPAGMAMIIERNDSVVVYAVAGDGKDRMVWMVESLHAIHVCSSIGQALSKTIPAVKPPQTATDQAPDAAADAETA